MQLPNDIARLVLAFASIFVVVTMVAWAYLAHAQIAATARICGPDSAPSPASTNGYTCEVFWDNFGSSSTIDSSNTKAAGFKWYLNNKWPSLAEGDSQWQNFPVTPSGDVTIVAGGLQDNPSTNPGPTVGGVDINSCVTTGNPRQRYGYAIDANRGYYIDVNWASESSAGQQGGNNWWPVIWMISSEFVAGLDPSPSTAFFGEVDIVEDINVTPPTTRFVHAWSITGGVATDNNAAVGKYQGGLPHTYGMLEIPERAGGGTGSITAYIDDATDPGGSAKTWTSGNVYEVLETQHYCMLITSGHSQAIVLGSIRVWQ